MTQRIELIFEWLELNFLKWLKEMNFFNFDSQDWTLFLWIWRKELDFFVSWVWRKDLDPFQIWRNELDPFQIWRKELDPFSKYDSKNFFVRVQEWNFFEYDSWNWTLFFFFFEHDSRNGTLFFSDWKNWIFFWTLFEELNPFYYVFKNWTLFSNKTPRIEPCFLIRLKDFVFEKWLKKNQKCWIWLKELNFFLNVIQRFLTKTHRIVRGVT